MDKIKFFYVDFNLVWKKYQKENDTKDPSVTGFNLYIGNENSYCLTLPAYTDNTYSLVKRTMKQYKRNYYIKRYGYSWD